MPELEADSSRPRFPRHPAAALVGLSGVLLLVFGLYGIDSPCIWGHYGFHNAEYMTRARNTVRHGAILPFNMPGWDEPKDETLYLHHPILTHHLNSLTLLVLGDHEYSARAASLIPFITCWVLLILLLWRRWGPWQAGLGALLWVLIPINVWFSNNIDAGLPSIAAMLGFFIAYLRWLDIGTPGSAAGALVCMALAGGFEWSPYFASVPIGLHVLYTAYRRRGRYLVFVPLFAVAVTLPLALHALIVWKTGHWEEMGGAYKLRASSPKLGAFLFHMWRSAVAMYTAPLFFAMWTWLLLRAVALFRRRAEPRDLVAATFLFAQLTYAVVWRNAIWIHAYRFFYGNVVCVLAAVELCQLAAAVAARLGRERTALWQRVAPAVVGVALVGSTAMFAVRALLESRLRGGVPLWGSYPYNPETRKVAFGTLVRDSTEPGVYVFEHPTWQRRAELKFYLDRDLFQHRSFPELESLPAEVARHSVIICIPAAVGTLERPALIRLIRTHPVRVVDEWLMIDLRREGSDFIAYRTTTPERGALRTYFEGPYARKDLEPVEGATVDALVASLQGPSQPAR